MEALTISVALVTLALAMIGACNVKRVTRDDYVYRKVGDRWIKVEP